MRYLFANWKMYVNQESEVVALAKQWRQATTQVPRSVLIGLLPDFIDLVTVKKNITKSSIKLGAQDCAPTLRRGALTGEISPRELRRLGCRYVLIGHSERRWQLGESDRLIAKKYEAALAARLVPILCVGERRRSAHAEIMRLVRQQLRPALKNVAKFIIAYEPSWAIGTDKTAGIDHIVAVHTDIRKILIKALGSRGRTVPILYGGSVQAAQAKKIVDVPEVNGLLVGHASVKRNEISKLVNVFNKFQITNSKIQTISKIQCPK